MRTPVRVGVIADTHGLLRPEAAQALAGSDLILHAGDIAGRTGDGAAILEALGRLAPLRAVRGNNDRGPWANALPERDLVEVGGVRLYLLHDRQLLDVDPAPAGVAAIIAGHSHRPLCQRRGGALHFNPGSAGPRRFRLPVTVGRLVVDGGAVEGEVIDLA